LAYSSTFPLKAEHRNREVKTRPIHGACDYSNLKIPFPLVPDETFTLLLFLFQVSGTMADVAKTVKVVSNSSACGVSLCELTSHSAAPDSLDILNTTPNNTDVSELTLNLPSPEEETSLQELIESELALRKELIESQFSPRISDYTDTVDELDIGDNAEVTETDRWSVKYSPKIVSPQDYGESDYETMDINTQFILAERNHSFQTFTGNDTFFFHTLDDTQINGTDPYLKDEQGLTDSYLEEECNVVDSETENTQGPSEIEVCSTSHQGAVDECLHGSSESDSATDSSILKDGIDQVTLSAFDPFTTIVDSSKSEPIDNPDIVDTPSSECADSDFVCLQGEASGGDKFGEGVIPSQNVGPCDYVETFVEGGNVECLLYDDIPTNDIVTVNARNSMGEFECGSDDFTRTLGHFVTNVFQTVEIDDDEIPLTPEEAASKTIEEAAKPHLTVPQIDVIPPDDNDRSESDLVSNEDVSVASSPDVEMTNTASFEDGVERCTAAGETYGTELKTSEDPPQIAEDPDSNVGVNAVHAAADVADEVPDVCSKSTDTSSYSDVSVQLLLLVCMNLCNISVE